MSRGQLSVFAKAPVAGRVKTRLSPPLSPVQAAELYAAMLDDVLAASARIATALDLAPVLDFDPPEARALFAARVPAGFGLRSQRGEDLAARMANAFTQMAAGGAERMVLRGSDSPGLALEHVAEAIAALDAGADVALTPDQSGGYALIALKEPREALFSFPLSTRQVLDETIRIANKHRLEIVLTQPGFDLDVGEDLARVDALPPTRSCDLCPRTVEKLRSLRESTVL